MAAQNKGGRFVTYQWFVPLPIFHPTRRLSKVYYIPSGKNPAAHAWKFNLICLIIGWWGLPWGPIYVLRSIRLNNLGGVDVTEDVYLNINKASYEAGRIRIERTAVAFVHPQKSDAKEFRKVFQALIRDGVIKNPPYIGIDLNADENEQDYFLIGFEQSINGVEQQISDAIYKRFFKHTEFMLFELNADFEEKAVFMAQGLKVT